MLLDFAYGDQDFRPMWVLGCQECSYQFESVTDCATCDENCTANGVSAAICACIS